VNHTVEQFDVENFWQVFDEAVLPRASWVVVVTLPLGSVTVDRNPFSP
jgi:hypothetical protein